eukprot:12297-Heterococcus_DN1.PRE.1
MTVNGKPWPYHKVEERTYRFNLVNAGACVCTAPLQSRWNVCWCTIADALRTDAATASNHSQLLHSTSRTHSNVVAASRVHTTACPSRAYSIKMIAESADGSVQEWVDFYMIGGDG